MDAKSHILSFFPKKLHHLSYRVLGFGYTKSIAVIKQDERKITAACSVNRTFY